MADAYPGYPILAFLAAIVVLIPLPWHFQAWNAGTCLFMIWTSIACLNLGINSVVWHSSAINYAPVWCDISTRIVVAAAVAIPTASLCINRRLYKIATVSTISVSRAEKRHAVIVDLSLGIGLPLLQIIMQYIVSGHRFDIYEGIGCYPFTYNTPVAYPLSIAWPVVIGMISAVYCVLTLLAFYKRRAQFSGFLSANKSLNPNRYFRLMALAATDLLCTAPISIYGMVLNLTDSKVYPWISWADTHAGWSAVHQYPAALWRMERSAIVAFELTRWSPIFCAFVFFAFFGFAAEARRHYHLALTRILDILHIRSCFEMRSSKLPFLRLSGKSLGSPHSFSSSKLHMLASTPTLSPSLASESLIPPPYSPKLSPSNCADWLPATPSTAYLSPNKDVHAVHV